MSKQKTEVLVPLTENDIQELKEGGEHFWTFEGVDMRLYNVDLLNNNCPRCIEEWEDDDGNPQDGEEIPSHCPECLVCEDCEHLSDCKYAE